MCWGRLSILSDVAHGTTRTEKGSNGYVSDPFRITIKTGPPQVVFKPSTSTMVISPEPAPRNAPRTPDTEPFDMRALDTAREVSNQTHNEGCTINRGSTFFCRAVFWRLPLETRQAARNSMLHEVVSEVATLFFGIWSFHGVGRELKLPHQRDLTVEDWSRSDPGGHPGWYPHAPAEAADVRRTLDVDWQPSHDPYTSSSEVKKWKNTVFVTWSFQEPSISMFQGIFVSGVAA